MIGPETVDEMARAVECFVELERGATVDSQYLIMLASHALASLGEDKAARKLLTFGTGMARPAEWEISGEGTMWVLDLKQLTVWDGAPLELVFFRCLHRIIDAMAGAWDNSGGVGVLGLRHVCAAAAGLLGEGANKKRISALVEEVSGLCSERLVAAGRERGWSDVPQVVNLDF